MAKKKKIELKTKPTKLSVTAFVKTIADEDQQRDIKKLTKIFREVTGKRAVMWGPSIVGYGKYTYKRANGAEGEFMRTGFSPRKGTLVLYIMPGYTDHGAVLKKLGKHKLGKSCLYIKKLDDVDLKVLTKLIKAGWKDMEKRYGKA